MNAQARTSVSVVSHVGRQQSCAPNAARAHSNCVSTDKLSGSYSDLQLDATRVQSSRRERVWGGSLKAELSTGFTHLPTAIVLTSSALVVEDSSSDVALSRRGWRFPTRQVWPDRC